MATSIFNEIQELFKELLVGKELVINTINNDDDLIHWLNKNKKPLIIESFEAKSWGVWVKGCPYRIDMDDVDLNNYRLD